MHLSDVAGSYDDVLMMESSAAVDQSNIAACESQLADITIQSQKMSNDSAGVLTPSSLDECGAAALTTESDARESQPHSDTNQDLQVQEIKTPSPDVPGQQSELGSFTDMAEEAITNPQHVSSSPVQCSESEPLSSYPPAEGTCGPVASQEGPAVRPPPSSSTCDLQVLEAEVLQRLTFSQAVFKSQQRGDPDLTCQQKIALARDLLHNKPPAFFSRFGRHMVEEDLPFLRQLSGEHKYMVDFCIKEIENKCDSKKNSVRVKNRRYEAMKQLQSGGEYFSDEQIKARDPLLYEQMVGQYLTGEDAQAAIDRSDLRLSNILVKHMDIIQNNTIYNIQKEYEVGLCSLEPELSNSLAPGRCGWNLKSVMLKLILICYMPGVLINQV